MVTIHGLHDKLVKGELSAVELTKAYIARKDAVEPQVQAFLSDNRELRWKQLLPSIKNCCR